MLKYCNFNGIGVIPWAPVAAGSLTRPFGTTTTRSDSTPAAFKTEFSEADKTIINRVEEISKKRGQTMAQIALAWVGAKVASPIVGISSVKRLDDAINPGFKLTEEEEKYLEEP